MSQELGIVSEELEGDSEEEEVAGMSESDSEGPAGVQLSRAGRPRRAAAGTRPAMYIEREELLEDALDSLSDSDG